MKRSWIALTLVAPALLLMSAPALALDVWIGTAEPGGNGPQPEGIYHATFDGESGKLGPARLVAKADSPGFVAPHPSAPVLYATGAENGAAAVVAWRIERADDGPRLTKLNAQPTTGGGACHVSVDRTGSVLLSAHYGGGSVASYAIGDDGAIGAAKLTRHAGASKVVPSRQEAPHPHWIGVSPDNRFALVPDLGLDRVKIYAVDAAGASLTPHGEAVTPQGGGPRHLAWRPDGRFAYVIDELVCGVSAYAWDAAAAALTRVDSVRMMTDAERADEAFTSASEVAVHPSGRFVYAAVRGHDTISVFTSDPQTGGLTLVEREPTRGSWPRHFALSPDGRWLVAAGRDSNNLAVFAVDESTGRLRYTLNMTTVPRPICVVIR